MILDFLKFGWKYLGVVVDHSITTPMAAGTWREKCLPVLILLDSSLPMKLHDSWLDSNYLYLIIWLECACVNNDNFTALVSGGGRLPSTEHVYCVAITFKMTGQVEQQICITFGIKLEHSSMETTQLSQKATAMDNWWLAASSRQCAPLCSTSYAEFLVKYQITQPPFSPDLVPYNFWLFPKLKSLLKGKRFHTIDEIQEIWQGSWWWLELNEVPNTECLLWKGLRCHCPKNNIPSIFFNKYSYFLYYMAGYHLDRPSYLTCCLKKWLKHFGYLNSRFWYTFSPNEWIELLRWQKLLIKCELLSETYNFGKIESTTVSLSAFQYLVF